MTTTDLDKAHAAMTAHPDDDAARLWFYEQLADADLFMLLAAEPSGDETKAEIFDIADGRFALVFDTEARLAEFTGRPVPYAGLSGRGLASVLAGEGIGLAFNLQVAPSEMLIPSEAIDWLAETLAKAPQTAKERITGISALHQLPASVIDALGRKLSRAAVGFADSAFLARATYDSGASGHLLCFVGAPENSEAALAQAVAEAVQFSGIDAGQIDVVFLPTGDKMADRLGQVGHRFDIPKPKPAATPPSGPGMDPTKPPRL